MAEDDAELVGGIAVSIGASHAQLPADLAAADRLLEKWASRKITIQVGAQFTGGQGPVGGRAPAQAGPAPIRYGAAATTGIQAAQGQNSLQRAINDALSKTGERLDENGDVVAATTSKIKAQKQAVIEVQQAAATPTALDLGNLDGLQNDLKAIAAELREIVVLQKEMAAAPPPKATTAGRGGGGGKRSRGRTAAAGGDEGGEGEVDPYKIQYVDRIEKQRRAAARVQAQTAIDINRSEQSLNRQRQREEAAAARTSQRQRQVNFPEYINRSDEIPASSTIAPLLTPQRRAERDRQEAEARRQRASNPPSPPPPPDPRIAAERAAREREVRRNQFDQQQSQSVNAALAQSARVRQFQVDEEDNARRDRARRAAITGGGQTSRTLSSGLGALFGGTRGAQIEAQIQAQAATRQLTSARAAIKPLDDVIRGLERAYSGASAETRQFAGEQIRAIKGTEQYRSALGNLEKATLADAEAQAKLEKISSGTSVVRNLAAITAGGIAFGIGLKAVDTVGAAAAAAIGNFIDIQTGFGFTSTRVTTALAQQTLQLHGNADAAIAAATAQAGLSDQAGEALSNQLRLTTQIKAGAQAQQKASELFRAAAGVGNAPTGLYGGYGGVLGTALFAQQLGGGRGFSETTRQDLSALTQGRGGSDLLGDFNRGLQFTFDKGIRDVLTSQAAAQGNIPTQVAGFDIMEFGAEFGRALRGEPAFSSRPGYGQPPQAQPATLTTAGQTYIDNLNAAAKRGAAALGEVRVAAIEYTTDQDKIAQGIAGAAAAMDPDGVARAAAGFVLTLDGMVAAGKDYQTALEEQAAGVGINDPAALGRASLLAERQRQRESAAMLDTIRSRQQFETPGIIAGIGRQQQFASQTQLPVQQLLSALAQPNLAVGTGIAKGERASVSGDLKEAQGLQDQLNQRYSKGEQIVRDTYRPAIVQNFGEAAAQQFDTALKAVRSTGAAIASIQEGISNEQAAYSVAQYNFQLQIARRSLRDIAGLTGANLGVEASHLGLLQRENLELSRQGQQLQFQMSQRQINFQQAVAGFQAPGITPEERQANIKEAQIEAGFAQKQLDIQKQMFGNQVQIVDISNLRQGLDLVQQIGLLQRGRQVTLDTAAAEQKLTRLNQLQAQNVAQVGTYLSAVDNVVSVAFGQIAELEGAAGRAMSGVAVSILGQFGIFIRGLNTYMTQGVQNGGLGMGTVPGSNKPVPYASGGVIGLSGPTRIGDNAVAGEAGDETLIVLSKPRSIGGIGGGGSVVVNFLGDIHTGSTADLDRITQAVLRAMGRGMSTAGLRTGG